MILMVYNKQICKEFLLPNIHNADYELILLKQIFSFEEDLKLKLQNSQKGWELVATSDYSIRTNEEHEEKHLLVGQDILNIKTRRNERFQIVVIDGQLTFPVWKKYDIGRMKEFSVGKSEENMIQYNYMELISSSHARFIHQRDGWHVEDYSRNGIFCGNHRIQGSRRLKFADHIEIFGLHILFLEKIVAVGTFYGELSVREDILKPVDIPEVPARESDSIRKKETKYFHRSPRNLPVIYKEPVEIEAPPAPKLMKEKPMFLTIGPAFTMAIPMMLGCGFAIFGSRLSGYTSSAFMYTGLITAVASAVIGGVWAVMNMNYAKKENSEEEEQRFNAYSNYLMDIAATLRNQYGENVAALNQMYPSAAQCVRYNENIPLLWNRNFTHEDFLYQRLGMGELPFQVEIEIPKEKFTLIDDSLATKPRMIKEEFQTLKNVPVGISLTEKRLIGLVGGEKKIGAISMMHSIVAGITASHSYTDVKLVFIYDEQDTESTKDWECMRWFPHVWSEDKSTRYMASTEIERNDIFFELSNVIRSRSQNETEISHRKRSLPKPYYILFVSDPSLLEGEILAKYIYEAREEYGITTFLMVENQEQLPNTCEEVIENDQYFRGFYNLMNTSKKKDTFVPDYVDPKELEYFGKVLSDVRVNEVENSSEIPGNLTFLGMYDVSSPKELKVAERWRVNRNYHTMRALIGKKAGNVDCYLDIHEKFHGPHGLMAGTTGSGKSETLQTYILSLAVEFSPEDVCFFIIDFKGGGMANLFSDLPHLSGQISNLSGNQVRRAMISIRSENQRRQRIFSEYGVNNINLYTKMYKNHATPVPIPHLFIIIDEFAELKREEPEFMRELISVAQVGRSLGVHLILATQKPSGTVDDNIWSNSRFRLCLRVQDRQDSNDMLHKPDAAFITQAGRGYLQVGNDEIYELFQSGYSGAIYDETSGGSKSHGALLTRTGKEELTGSKRKIVSENGKEKTELQAVIEHLNVVAREVGYQKSPKLWMPVLGEEIYLEQLEGYQATSYRDGQWSKMPEKWSLSAIVGLYDDPEGQAQKPFNVNLSEDGHLAVVGSVVSGKSTFLQTLIYSFIDKYSPEILQMYLIDYSSHLLSSFENAPHVGGVVFDNEEERLDRLIHLLTEIMDERKKLFAGGNYSQYVQVHGVTLPAILVAVDNYSSFREKTKNKYDDVIMRLAREGVGYGIYLVITAAGFSMAEIPSRLGDNLRTVISLEQADKFKYMEVLRTTKIPLMPEVGVKGRGLAVVDGRILEFQTALSVQAQDDFNRGQKIEEYLKNMAEAWDGPMARKIPEIPENPTLTILKENEDYRSAVASKKLLPFGYGIKDASIYSICLNHTYCYVVSGKSRTGKTNVMKLLLSAALEKAAEICVIEKGTSELKYLLENVDFVWKTFKDPQENVDNHEEAATNVDVQNDCADNLKVDNKSLEEKQIKRQITYVSNSKELFEYFNQLLPEFVRRNKLKHKLMDDGLTEEEIFDEISKEKPIFIFIGDLSEFFSMVYKPEEGVGAMSGFLENILEKGSLHNIYFIGCLKAEDQGLVASYRGYTLFTSYKKGIHLGGNLVAQKLFKFQNVPFTEQSKAMKRGLGYVPDEEEDDQALKVVVPLAK